jgi:Tat protein translocase TatC
MWKFLFQKVVKMREKVAVDLGHGDAEKPFMEHLEDLRDMIVRMAITMAVTTIGTFFFYKDLFRLIRRPLKTAGLEGKMILQNFDPAGGFMTAMNISFIAGMIIAFPLLGFFLLQFVLPGLKAAEKKLVFPSLAVGAGLFALGVCFSFYVVTPRALLFFYEFNVDLLSSDGTDANGVKAPPIYIWELTKYVKFVTQFCLIFGACFELPVVVIALVKLDILSYKVMKTTRTYAMIGVVIVAAIITPTQDAMTLALLAGPMYVLYEICIWIAWWLEKKDRAANPEYYKGLEEDEKAMEAPIADWDNDNYNPWNEDRVEDEDLHPKSSSDTLEVKPASGTVPHDSEKPADVTSESSSETPDAKPLDGSVPHESTEPELHASEKESPPPEDDHGDTPPAKRHD